MTTAIAPVVTIPIPGCSPLVLCQEDVVTHKAWYDLSYKKSPYLGEKDFKDYDTYMKYWLVTMGLLDFPMVLICGEEGGGKSLVMAWLTNKIVTLFGKRCTLDWTPPKPELFGKYFNFYDEDFTEKIQTELNRLAQYGKRPPEDELKKLIIFNTVFGLDEGDKYGDTASRTNLTKLIGRIIRRRRHYHTGCFMVFVDPSDADKRLIYDRRSHEISCGKDWFYKDTCSYLIHNRRTGISKYLHLRPQDWTHLWDSFNVVGVSHNVDVYLGGRKRKKVVSEEIEDN